MGELLFQSRKRRVLLHKQSPRIRGGCFYFTKQVLFRWFLLCGAAIFHFFAEC